MFREWVLHARPSFRNDDSRGLPRASLLQYNLIIPRIPE